MLKQLNVRNYVLIDSLEVAFPEGLVIITGQTGAGKSILLGALSLLLGAKADASAVGEGGDNCVVEALFVLGPDDPARKVLEENDLDWNGGELLIRLYLAFVNTGLRFRTHALQFFKTLLVSLVLPFKLGDVFRIYCYGAAM